MAGNVICSKCGQENDAEQSFCASCGAFLEWSGEKVEGDGANPAEITPATPAGPAPSPAPPARAAVPGWPVSPPPPSPASSSSAPAAPTGSDGELAGLARLRSTTPVQPAAVQPPLVSPVRPGPPARRVPAPSAEASAPVNPSASTAATVAVSAVEATIACPSCGRANPIDRNFCHSCGVLLRPKPAEPAARRRHRAGSPADGRAGLYRLAALLLLFAIIIVGSFLLSRLTGHSSAPTPLPSPTKASAGQLLVLGQLAEPAVRWHVAG